MVKTSFQLDLCASDILICIIIIEKQTNKQKTAELIKVNFT